LKKTASKVKVLSCEKYVSKRAVFNFKKKIKVISSAAVGGEYEKKGPLGKYLDIYCEDEKLSADTWEGAENEMCRLALNTALSKKKLRDENIDILLAGDLMNQCTGSGYGLSEFNIPYIGLYGACSTFAEAIMTASCMIEAGVVKTAAVVVSSHFCTAQRQFRFPLEYGAFAESTAQRTVTGAGCVILSESCKDEKGVFVTGAMPGIVFDRGIKDASNMGAAMCTAAADTIERYFAYTKENPLDFDLIVTGDLGKEGKSMALEMMQKKYPGIVNVYDDCGVMIYDTENQDVSCGGSGCGCSAVVSTGYILNSLEKGEIKKCLVEGTGAMMSPQSLLQGNSIPAVAHLVRLESVV